MKVVIDISEEIMEYIKNNGCLSVIYSDEIAKAIIDSTPLPKGHGRLIDADAYVKEYGYYGYLLDIDIDYFNKVIPTIIEADK